MATYLLFVLRKVKSVIATEWKVKFRIEQRENFATNMLSW